MKRTMIFVLLVILFSAYSASAQGPFDPIKDEQYILKNLDRLKISSESSIELNPGGSYKFQLAFLECCYFDRPVRAPVKYSTEPLTGATINQTTGEFHVDKSTPHGTMFTVKADVYGGKRIITAKVYVYTPEANPFVGLWKEDARLDCNSGQWTQPANAINELKFKANGRFSVTWIPFEIYIDYVGNYSFDLKSGKISMEIEDGNYVPPDFKGSGTFEMEGANTIVLKNIYLGTKERGAKGSKDGDAPQACGHRFVNLERTQKQAGPAKQGPTIPTGHCFAFNPQNLIVDEFNFAWGVMDSKNRSRAIFSYPKDEKDSAEQVLKILQFYNINEKCYTNANGMTLYFSSGKVPEGPYPGESCRKFDPQALSIRQGTAVSSKVKGTPDWEILENGKLFFRLWGNMGKSDEATAREIVGYLQQYGLNEWCILNGLRYLRK